MEYRLLGIEMPVNIAKIIYKYNFNIRDEMTPDDVSDMLNDADANQMVIDINTLENEVVQKSLENYILDDYLQKCTRKSLLRRSSARKRKSSSILLTLCSSSMGSILKTKNVEFNLNFQTRNELARKLLVQKGRIIDYIETNTKEEIKQLKGLIEELKSRNKDAIELKENFDLNFLHDSCHLQEKFYKFTNEWLKTSKMYILRMRFIIRSLENDCHHLRTELHMKCGFCGFLKPINFIQLAQNYDNLKRDFGEMLVKLSGIKSSACLTYLILNDMKNRTTKLETIVKECTDRDERGRRCLKQLQKQAAIVESHNNETSCTLAALKKKFQTYIAPSVNQYVELKEKLVALEKEEKILQRKIAIANIKFKNFKLKQFTSSI